MSDILFINACVREGSRTLMLAKEVLLQLGGDFDEVKLYELSLSPLDNDGIAARGAANAAKDFSDGRFALARQFAAAKTVVIAAPYWDMMFPAVLKSFFEDVTVVGLTFAYGENGHPVGLCNAEKMIYVTTSGGPIMHSFGFDYTKAVATTFYGINDVRCVKAEGLDIRGADVEKIMMQAKDSITEILGAIE